MTVKVINTMQHSKLLFFILIGITLTLPISSLTLMNSEQLIQQVEGQECSIDDVISSVFEDEENAKCSKPVVNKTAEGSEGCPEGWQPDNMLGCMKIGGNLTSIPEPKTIKKKDCEKNALGIETCTDKTITNGTYSYKSCRKDNLSSCIEVTQTDETSHYSSNNWNFPKLW